MKKIKFLLLLFTVISYSSFVCKAADSTSYQGVSLKPGDSIEKNVIVISNTEKQLANGMIENYCLFNNSNFSEQTSGYFLTIDLMDKDNAVDIVSGYSNYNASKYGMATVTEQAYDYESKHPKSNVIAGINADFFLMKTGEPRGALVMNKKIYHPINKRNFFAITRDGTPVICNNKGEVLSKLKKGNKLTLEKNIRHAVGGGILLVKNGKIAPAVSDSTDKDKATRSAIGIKADGTVIVYITHGTKKPVANGETYQNVAKKMLKAGCQTALALDGGGSSTYVSNATSTNKLEVKNHPSDGAPRQIASSLLFVTPEDSDNSNTEKVPDEKEHTYIYVPDKNQVLCNKNCDSHTTYTGFVKDENNTEYFLFQGNTLKGWKIIDEQPYYFNSDGVIQTVTIHSQTTASCTSTGNITYYCDTVSSGDSKTFSLKILNKAPGHDYNADYICKNCEWKAVSLEECTISLPYKSYYYNGQKRAPQISVSYMGKKLDNNFDFEVTYKNNTNVGIGTIVINPNITTYVDITETRGSLLNGDNFEKTFSIILRSPSNLESTSTGSNSLRINWEKADHVDGYRITKYDSASKSYQLYQYTTDSSCEIINLSSGYTYGFRVASYKLDSNDNKVYSSTKYVRGITNPRQVSNLKLSSSSKVLTAKWKKTTCSGYQIAYATNSDFSDAVLLTLDTNTITSHKISNLSKNQEYYIKIRAYKDATNCTRTYGEWSSAKSLKTK